MEKKDIFRKSSLERISSPEQLNEYIQVSNPSVWMVIGALILLVVAVLIWGFLGSMPTTVSASGVLFPDGALVEVEANGVVGRAKVSAGAHISAGDTVLIMQDGQEIVSPLAGTVVSVCTAGDTAGIGAPGAYVLPDDAVLDTVICYYSATATSIQPGIEAQVSLATAPRDDFGYIRGEVISVGTYPVSTQDMVDVLGNAQLASSLMTGESQVKVVIQLAMNDQDEQAQNGYAWSNKRGLEVKAPAGTLCDVLIITESLRPIDYLLGQ